MVESMQQSSATPKNRDVGRGLRKIVACSQPYLAVASCIYSFWHGVIPTSYFIFNDFYIIVAVWQVRKHGDDSYPGQLQRQSSAGDRGPVAGVGGRVSRSGKSGISYGKGEGHVVYASVNCVCNVCGSTHSCGCVVNGTFARAAF